MFINYNYFNALIQDSNSVLEPAASFAHEDLPTLEFV